MVLILFDTIVDLVFEGFPIGGIPSSATMIS